MKKIISLFCLAIFTQASFAYMQEFTSSDIKTLQGKGYSQELLRIVDTTRYITQEGEKDYVPFYSRKRYSDNRAIKWYQVLQRYWDPMQDENLFGVREIDFNNRYFDYSPSYNQKVSPNDRFIRLDDEDVGRLETAGKIIKGSAGVENAVEETQEDL